jgi:hypothetical protein
VREIGVSFPTVEAKHDVLAPIWARARISDLMRQDFAGVQRGAMREDLVRDITQLGLDYQLMTQFTSFVAVEERVVVQQGRPVRVEVPVEMPEGVSYEGIFGPRFAGASGSGGGSGFGPGVVGGVAGGFGGGVLLTPQSIPKAIAPPPPAEVRAAPQSVVRVAPRQFDAGRVMMPGESAAISSLALRKLDPKLVAALTSADQTSKLEVQILLRDASAPALEELRKVGLEDSKPAGSGLQIFGRIAIADLKDLAGLSNVRYVVARGA